MLVSFLFLNASSDFGVSEQNDYFNDFGVCGADSKTSGTIVSELDKVLTFMS